MRGRFTTGALLGALVAGTLVAAAQPASADIGDTTPFELPNGAPAPSAIVSVANGDLWMSPATGTSLTSITTQGVASGHPLPGTFGKGATFGGITQTPDGRIWVSERFSSTLSSVNTAGADFTQIALPKSTDPIALTADASGNVWFVAPLSVRYGRVTPAGAVSIFQPGLSTPADVSSGPSGPVLAMIRARKGPVIAVATEGDTETAKVADDVIYVPKTIEPLYPILTSVPLQLFAYHIAVARGCDVDKPRNLAKSVTVQ